MPFRYAVQNLICPGGRFQVDFASAKTAYAEKNSMPTAKIKQSKPQTREFDEVYVRLCQILRKHKDKLSISVQKPGTLWMDVTGLTYRGKPLFYGGVRLGKNYVSYYLMPAYMCEDISPELKKRKQGKSCFNFTSMDEKLFSELEKLTAEGFQKFRPDMFDKIEKSTRKK